MLGAISRRWSYRRERRDALAQRIDGQTSDETALLRRVEILLADIRRDIEIFGVIAVAALIYWVFTR